MCKRSTLMFAAVAMFLAWGALNAAAEYPEGAKGFAGMLTGKITAKGENQITLEVTKVEKIWKTSTAKSPDALVGKSVVIKFEFGSNKAGEARRKLFDILKVGDSDSFDVKNASGDTLSLLELTADQRKRAGLTGK